MNEIGHQPILTTIHANNDVSIKETTNQIRSTLQALLSQLNDRVYALAACAQFDSALNDAAVMRTLSPSCTLGYLCSGYVYMQQGRPWAAMDMYDRGLDMVPRGDAGYHKLARAKASAQYAADRRLDFISKLPLDTVVKNIVPRLHENIREYMRVSRSWYGRILQSDINDLDLEKPCACRHSRETLIRLGHSIESLTLLDCCSKAPMDVLFPRDASFNSLQQLKILGTESHSLNDTSRIDSPSFLTALGNSVGSHLTHITINQRGEPAIHLNKILESCPNLISLHASHLDITTPLKQDYPNVIDLVLDHTFPEFTSTNLSSILVHLKSLQSLAISPCSDSHVLASIQDLCPLLKRFECCCSGPCSRIDIPRTNQQPDKEGLKDLHIDSSGVNIYAVNHVLSLIMPHMETLESFTFKGVLDGVDHKDLDDWEHQFDKLHTLSFTAYEPYVIPFCTWIIRHAPFLESVDLELSAATHGAIFCALSQRTCLQELKLGIPDGAHDEEALRGFLMHHVHLGALSGLEKFTIYFEHPMNTQPWIIALGQLSRLRFLHLTSMDGVIHEDFTTFVVSLVTFCTNLEHLILEGQITDGNQLFLLRRLKKLKHLRLSKLPSLSSDLLKLSACPRLTHLEIPENVDSKVLDELKGNIGNVDLIRDH